MKGCTAHLFATRHVHVDELAVEILCSHFGASYRKDALGLDAGFQQNGILIVNMDVRRAGTPEERRVALFADITSRIAAIPGVSSAAQAFIIPVSGSGWETRREALAPRSRVAEIPTGGVGSGAGRSAARLSFPTAAVWLQGAGRAAVARSRWLPRARRSQ